jgi:hypothetical protein
MPEGRFPVFAKHYLGSVGFSFESWALFLGDGGFRQKRAATRPKPRDPSTMVGDAMTVKITGNIKAASPAYLSVLS